MKRAVATIVALFVALTGCASSSEGPAPVEPISLVGYWQIDRAGDATTWVRFDARTFALWADCGILSGGWRLADTAIVATYSSRERACESELDAASTAWFEEIAVITPLPTGDFRLLDAAGKLVATLTRGVPPPPVAELATELTSRPELDAADIDFLRTPRRPVPEITISKDSAGEYVVRSPQAQGQFLALSDTGEAFAFDGCNTWSNGVYRYSDRGNLLLTWSVISSSTCEADFRFGDIATAGATESGLDVFDADGKLVARLVRIGSGFFE